MLEKNTFGWSLINDSRVSAATFHVWRIGLWTFVSHHYFWRVWRWEIYLMKQNLKRVTKLFLKKTLRKKRIDMVRKDRCCVGIYNNDRCYQDKLAIKSHVQILKWHRFPKDKVKHKWWQTLANRGRENFVASYEPRICSNHFVDRKPTEKHPNPTLDYLGQQTVSFKFFVALLLFFFQIRKLYHPSIILLEKDYDTIKDCFVSLVSLSSFAACLEAEKGKVEAWQSQY